MSEPELASVELYGGPADGRHVRIDPETIEAAVVSGGLYRRDGDVFRYYEPRQAPADTGDRAFDVIVSTIGEEKLAELLALVAVRQMCEGKIDWWQLLAARIDRMRETS